MAFRRISDLSSSLEPSGSGIIPISQDGITFGTTLDTIKGQIEGNLTNSFALTSSLNEVTGVLNDSTSSIEDLHLFSSSAKISIDALEVYTASLDDSFATDLELQEFKNYFNSYTSSNNNVNAYQNDRLDALESRSDSNDDLNVEQNNRLSSLETESGSIRSCLLYTSPSPRDVEESRMPSSA